MGGRSFPSRSRRGGEIKEQEKLGLGRRDMEVGRSSEGAWEMESRLAKGERDDR